MSYVVSSDLRSGIPNFNKLLAFLKKSLSIWKCSQKYLL